MLIRQRSTFADDLLLRVVFPYLNGTSVSRRLLAPARLWNQEVRLDSPTEAPRPAALLRDAWRRLAAVLPERSAKASAQ